MKLRVTLERSDGQIIIELVSHWSGVGPEPEDYNLHEMYPELIANVLQNLRSMCDEIEAGDAQPKLKNTETGDMRELRTSSGFGMAWKNLVE